MGIRYLVETVTIRLGESLLVHQPQQRTGMDVGDIVVSLITLSLAGAHEVHMPVVNLHPFHCVTGDDLSAIVPDGLCQQLCKLLTTTHETTGTIDIEGTDDSMYVSRCLIGPAAIKGIHIGKDATQLGVVDVAGDEGVGCHHELFGVGKHIRTGWTEPEEIHLLSYGKNGVHITPQVVAFLGEIGCQRVYEILTALRDTVTLTVFSKIKTVRAVLIYLTDFDTVEDAEILTDAVDVAAFLHTADDMHARVEQLTEATERLQTATDDGILLEHRHLKTFLRQDGTAEQTSQSSPYNHNLIHSLSPDRFARR